MLDYNTLVELVERINKNIGNGNTVVLQEKVSSITELTNDNINQLKCGDIVVKKTGNQYQHNILIDDETFKVRFNIVNNISENLTLSSLKGYLTNNGFNTNSRLLNAFGLSTDYGDYGCIVTGIYCEYNSIFAYGYVPNGSDYINNLYATSIIDESLSEAKITINDIVTQLL